MKKNKKGFTLTELIIVIVIIGILAAVLIPSISGYIKKAKISKGTQNARNITSLVIGEVLFNDEEFLMPKDLIAIASKSGYDLVSELDDYAYWYDTQTNVVKYVNINDAIQGGVKAAELDNRSLVEALSPAHPRWLYVDQTDNEIHKAISTINNLVKLGNEKAGTGASRIEVLDSMDELVNQISNSLVKTKLLDNVAKSQVVDYIESFNTTDTIYYSESGIYNKQLESNNSDTANVTVERGLIADETVNILAEGVYDSVYITFNAPLIIPGTVKNLPAGAIAAIESGVVYLSANSGIDTSLFNSGVSVGSLADITYISYVTLGVKPEYTKKQYRFRNGVTFTVDSDINLLLDDDNILVQEKMEDGNYAYSYYDTKDGKHLDINGKYVIASPSKSLSAYTKEELVNNFEKSILSIYLIPIITVKDSDIDFTKFISLDGSLIGSFTINSTIEPFSTKLSAVMVDAEMTGYKIDNIGYITDMVTIVDQLNEVVDPETGKVTQTIDGNNSATINVNIPKDARKYQNYQNINVSVDYRYEYVEYTDFQLFGMDKPVRISTGEIYYDDEIRSSSLTGNLGDGYSFEINSLPEFTIDSGTYKSNQIAISKITVTDNLGNILFVRYYE